MSKEKGSMQAHQNLVKEFTIAVSKDFPNVMVIPYTVGMFRAWDDPDRVIRAGLKGVPDLIVFGNCWYLFFDAKTGKAVFNKNQRMFKNRMLEVSPDYNPVHKLTSVEVGINLIKQLVK